MSQKAESARKVGKADLDLSKLEELYSEVLGDGSGDEIEDTPDILEKAASAGIPTTLSERHATDSNTTADSAATKLQQASGRKNPIETVTVNNTPDNNKCERSKVERPIQAQEMQSVLSKSGPEPKLESGGQAGSNSSPKQKVPKSKTTDEKSFSCNPPALSKELDGPKDSNNDATEPGHRASDSLENDIDAFLAEIASTSSEIDSMLSFKSRYRPEVDDEQTKNNMSGRPSNKSTAERAGDGLKLLKTANAPTVGVESTTDTEDCTSETKSKSRGLMAVETTASDDHKAAGEADRKSSKNDGEAGLRKATELPISSPEKASLKREGQVRPAGHTKVETKANDCPEIADETASIKVLSEPAAKNMQIKEHVELAGTSQAAESRISLLNAKPASLTKDEAKLKTAAPTKEIAGDLVGTGGPHDEDAPEIARTSESGAAKNNDEPAGRGRKGSESETTDFSVPAKAVAEENIRLKHEPSLSSPQDEGKDEKARKVKSEPKNGRELESSFSATNIDPLKTEKEHESRPDKPSAVQSSSVSGSKITAPGLDNAEDEAVETESSLGKDAGGSKPPKTESNLVDTCASGLPSASTPKEVTDTPAQNISTEPSKQVTNTDRVAAESSVNPELSENAEDLKPGQPAPDQKLQPTSDSATEQVSTACKKRSDTFAENAGMKVKTEVVEISQEAERDTKAKTKNIGETKSNSHSQDTAHEEADSTGVETSTTQKGGFAKNSEDGEKERSPIPEPKPRKEKDEVSTTIDDPSSKRGESATKTTQDEQHESKRASEETAGLRTPETPVSQKVPATEAVESIPAAAAASSAPEKVSASTPKSKDISDEVFLYISMASGGRGAITGFNKASAILKSWDIEFTPVEISLDEKAKRLWKYSGISKGKTLPAVVRGADIKLDFTELQEANEFEEVEERIFDGL